MTDQAEANKMDKEYVVVDYEILMFLSARKKLQISTADTNLANFTNNALVESRVLHIRVLAEVFLSGGYPDDIKANRLLPDWCAQNSKIIDELSDAYKTELPILRESPKTLIDKHLAHATTQRGASFDWSPIIKKMEQPLINTLKTLSVKQFPSLVLLSET